MKTMNIVMSNDEIMKLVELAISLFVKKTTQIENDRYKSWEYCYHSFISARNSSSPDYDILSLHLAFYLASWGMYRGSSFLLQKDYKIHTPILFLHGDADTNVPVGESIQMFTALKLLGRETAFVAVKDQNHHILDYNKRQMWQNTIFAWFAKYLQDDSSWWDAIYAPKSL